MSQFIFPRVDQTALLIVDIQEKLLPTMQPAEVDKLLRNTLLLLELAKAFHWPVVYSEQYPKGLGKTEPAILAKLEEFDAVACEKIEFSCLRNETFAKSILPKLPPNVVVAGMEAHVCVLQTVMDLQARGYQAFVPLDAVASRDPANRDNGLALMSKVGAVQINTESLMFYALQRAGTDTFRHFSKLIR